MIPLSPLAERHIEEFLSFYEAKNRPEAIRNLAAAFEKASVRIEHAPGAGLASPRPYPSITRAGWRWIKEGPYWIGYVSGGSGPVIAAIYHASADIPGRI